MNQTGLSAVCLAALAFAPPASACTCLCEEPTASISAAQIEQQQLDQADYLFSGYIVKRKARFPLLRFLNVFVEGDETSITIRPVEILKGQPNSEIVVWESGPLTCRGGLPVTTGFVKVLAYEVDGRLELGACTSTCANGLINRLADEPR